MVDLDLMAINICLGARNDKQREGQWLFNHLPDQVANKVRGTLFDPFYTVEGKAAVREWLDNHLIFNKHGTIIGLFDGDTLLWEMAEEAYS